MSLEYKVLPVSGFKVLDDEKGVVSAIVSVTGVEDDVKDVIHVGAYAKTLAARTPKGAWAHDWAIPVSKTLRAEELSPGDERLPKTQRNGEPWPEAAGALLVETQFNLATQRGREAYEDAKFYGDEQEWSIGFSIPLGKSKVNPKTGVRDIFEVELFEYSQVLFGAMPLTGTVGVKAAQEAFQAAVKELGITPHEFRGDGDTCLACGQPDGTKGHIAPPSEEPLLEGDPVDVPRETSEDEPEGKDVHSGMLQGEPVTPAFGGVAEEEQPEAGQEQPEDDGAKALEDEVQALVRELLPQYMKLNPVEEGATEVQVSIDHEALMAEVKRRLAEKVYARIAGCYEERMEAVARAVRSWLRAEAASSDGLLGTEWSDYGYAYPEATFDDRVVFCVFSWRDEAPDRYFEAAYTFADGEVELAEAAEVEVTVGYVGKARERLGHSPDWAGKWLAAFDRMDPDGEKAGRVLSRKNAGIVLNAASALVDLLDAAGVDHPYGGGNEKAAPAPEGGAEPESEEHAEPEGMVLEFDPPAELLLAEAIQHLAS